MLLTCDWCLHFAEIDKVMEMLHHFGAYNRAVAQGGAQSAMQGGEIGLQRLGEDKHGTEEQDTKALGQGQGQGQDLQQAAPKHSPDAGDGAEAKRASIPSAVLAEFVASMLEQEQEPRLKKVLIMSQVQGWDRGDNPVLLLALVWPVLLALVWPVLLAGTLVATPFSLVASMSTCLQSYWTAVPTRILVQLRLRCWCRRERERERARARERARILLTINK